MASKLIKRTLEEAAQVEHAEIDFSDKVLTAFLRHWAFHTILSHCTAGTVPNLLFFKPVAPYPVLAVAIELVPSPSLYLLRVFYNFMLSFIVIL
jgi:hypothetical protein